MKVKFLKDYEKAKKDDITDIENEIFAKGLVTEGIVEQFEAPLGRIVAEVDAKDLAIGISDALKGLMKQETPKVEVSHKSFGEILRDVGHGKQLDGNCTIVGKSIVIGTPGAGGYATTVDTVTDTVDLLKSSRLGSLCRRYPLGGTMNELKFNVVSSLGNACAIYTEEQEIGNSTATVSQVAIAMKKLGYSYKVSSEALEDTGLLVSLINDAVTDEFAKWVDKYVISGTYATHSLAGIVGDTNTYSVPKDSAQANFTITETNINNMFTAFKSPDSKSAAWVMSRSAYAAVQGLKTTATQGYPLFVGPMGYAGAPWGTLKGLPIIVNDTGTSALGTVSDINLGDWSKYIIIQKFGLTTASSDHADFLNDRRVFRFTYRLGGKPVGIKLTANDGTYVADFVTLANRTS